jgi:hypothetical protein
MLVHPFSGLVLHARSDSSNAVAQLPHIAMCRSERSQNYRIGYPEHTKAVKRDIRLFRAHYSPRQPAASLGMQLQHLGTARDNQP